MAEQQLAGAAVGFWEVAAVKAQAGIAFTRAGLVNRWHSYLGFGESLDTLFVDLLEDGAGGTGTVSASGSSPVSNDREWSIESDVRMLLARYDTSCRPAMAGCQPSGHARRWELLAQDGKRIYVMESLGGFGNPAGTAHRVNVYEAIGP